MSALGSEAGSLSASLVSTAGWVPASAPAIGEVEEVGGGGFMAEEVWLGGGGVSVAVCADVTTNGPSISLRRTMSQGV